MPLHPGHQASSHALSTYVTSATLIWLWLLPPRVTSSLLTASASAPAERMTPNYSAFEHIHEPYDAILHAKLRIDLVEASPSSLLVTWTLSNTTSVDSTLQATALCETGNGKIISDKFTSAEDSFHFKNLNSDTSYVVCVHMLEKSRSTNTSILHYNCQSFSTIPLVRPDSVVGLILTLGYLFVMGGIGYVVWWKKAKQLRENEEEERRKIDDDEEEQNGGYRDNQKLASSRSEPSGCQEKDRSSRRPDGGQGESRNGAHDNLSSKSSDKGIGCFTGARTPKFQDIAEEDPIQLSVEGREISF